MLQRGSSGVMALYRQLPTWGKVTAVIVGSLLVLYLWQLLLGLLLLAALGVGMVTIVKWIVTSK